MEFFFFNNMTSKNQLIWTNTFEPRIFLEKLVVSAHIKLNSSQRKPLHTLK